MSFIRSFKGSTLFFIAFAFAVLIMAGVFYKADLKSDFELRLSHLKLKLLNSLSVGSKLSHLTLIGIDEDSITKIKGQQGDDLNFSDLSRLVVELLAQQPKSLSVVLHTQVFDRADPERAVFFDLLSKYRNLNIITLDHPYESFAPVYQSRIWSGDLHPKIENKTHNQVWWPYQSTNHNHLQFAALGLAKLLHADLKQNLDALAKQSVQSKEFYYLRPNYHQEFDFKSLKNVLETPNQIYQKDLILGYTAYRKYAFRMNRATYINLTGDAIFGDLEKGTPIIKAYALAAQSIASGIWLRDPHWSLRLFLLLLLVGFTFFVSLNYEPLWLGFFNFLSLSAYFLLSVWLLSQYSIELMVSEGVFWLGSANLLGMYMRILKKNAAYIKERSFSDAMRDVYKVQRTFVDNLSVQLKQMNQDIVSEAKILEKDALSELAKDSCKQLMIGAVNLNDYLHTITKMLQVEKSSLTYLGIKKNVHLANFVDEIFLNFKQEMNKKNIKFENHMPDKYLELHLEIVTQIMLNLASNAVKYVNPSGTIRVVLDRVHGADMIAVWDSGAGIPLGEQENIFEKFYRVKNDQVYQSSGTGLGLFLSRFLADLIKAKLTVESSEETGTTFKLELP